MDFNELKNKSVNELHRILAEERGKLYDLRLKLSVNQLKDVSLVRTSRTLIARIQMLLAEAKNTEKSTQEK